MSLLTLEQGNIQQLEEASAVLQDVNTVLRQQYLSSQETLMKPSKIFRCLGRKAMSLIPILTLRTWNDAPALASKAFGTLSGWVFIGFLFLYLAAIRYCSHAYHRDPTSVFFDPERGYGRVYSVERQEQADRFLSNVRFSADSHVLSQSKVCIGVATVARPGEQYVRGTIGSLLEGLTELQRREIRLTVLVAHTDPVDHPIYGEAWLEAATDDVLLYRVSDEQLEELKTWEKEKDHRHKAIFDYAYLLENCLHSGASWIAMIEDDTLAMAGWYPKAIDAIDTADAQHRWSSKVSDSEWLYLRLFYTEEFLGWNAEEWPRYVLASVIVISAVAISLSGIRACFLPKSISTHAILAICLFYTPACILLFFLAGRVSMLPLSPGVHQMPNFGCCAQGFVFSREMAPKVIHRLRMKNSGFVDMLLEEWADEEHLVRWAVVPSLLQHVGGRSSKGDDFGGAGKWEKSVAEKIWSFGFEMHRERERGNSDRVAEELGT